MNAPTCPLCHAQNEDVLWQTEHYRVIVAHEDPNVPAFCRVIWHEHVAEMTDLSPEARDELMNAVYRVEQAMRDVLCPSKINLASLGNVVPHLHWHIIARFEHDAYFPKPIWANPQRDNALVLPSDWVEQLKQRFQAA